MFLQIEILGGDFIKIEKWCNHEIRFVEKDGEWWAVLKDVCEALGLKTFDVRKRIEKDMVSIPLRPQADSKKCS